MNRSHSLPRHEKAQQGPTSAGNAGIDTVCVFVCVCVLCVFFLLEFYRYIDKKGELLLTGAERERGMRFWQGSWDNLG